MALKGQPLSNNTVPYTVPHSALTRLSELANRTAKNERHLQTGRARMSSDAELDEANALSTAETTAAPSTPTKRKRFLWSKGMTECLLSLRLGAMASSFTDSRSVAQLSAAWERL